MKHKFLKVFAALLVLLALAALLLPWKALIENKLKSELAKAGLGDVAFAVESVNPSGIVLKDISFGEALPLHLANLTVDFRLSDLIKKQLREIRAADLMMNAGEIKIRLSEAKLVLTDATHGEWSVSGLVVEDAPLPLPPLSGSGTAGMDDGRVEAAGDIASADASHQAAFKLNYKAEDTASRLTVSAAKLPWNGGVLSTKNAVFPLNGGKKLIPLRAERVSLDALLKKMTGGRASATGTVSGDVPLAIGSNGEIRADGVLKADGPGVIRLAPEAIPGDNEQLAVVRGVLSDFHYSALSLTLSGEGKGLAAKLAVAGNNPAAYEGKAVKLNVQLSGDVLSFLQQSVLPMGDPRQWLKQD